MMAPTKPPKAILFDIGGVVVVSPFQAILDYELANAIPPGWINFSIQKGPHDTGAWQLIERGECILDDTWFSKFKSQLEMRNHWTEFWAREVAKGTLKGDARFPPAMPSIEAKKLFWNMMNMSREPDPYMYPALKKLRLDGRFVLGALSNTVAFPPGIVDHDGVVFSHALVHPPPPHPHAADSTNTQDLFDTFISSAHVGLRKPDPRVYELAVRELDRVAREKGLGRVEKGDVLFLDDIGVNLKWARKSGLRTIKVDLGRSRDAVRELEEETGLKLLEGEGRAKL
ncbi:epoxide hydrolase-like protein [Amniculicola lignicola CBS 123094]|uniref:Epoxide hydrolase-like protein n=1 Tax=Amniculicola lignicola CBS 123094 TaxID=1392246 RepID=A0A6A5X2J7_9PLEO|nr:epoxide hydrolase-like protein [Amniculicola lignicola CBS 123094]